MSEQIWEHIKELCVMAGLSPSEVYQIDVVPRRVVFHRYALGEDGKPRLDENRAKIVVSDSLEVNISELDS